MDSRFVNVLPFLISDMEMKPYGHPAPGSSRGQQNELTQTEDIVTSNGAKTMIIFDAELPLT
jgi:hypothetical protein